MPKRKQKTKQKKRRREQSRRGKKGVSLSSSVAQGFDFGVDRLAAGVESVEFVSLLKQATIVGCLYRIVPGPWANHIPEISLIAVNPEPLKRAFAEFRRWDPEDGDAVKLTFVIPTARNGYLLAIEWEHTRARYSLLGPDRFFSPLLFGGTYGKRMDTQHSFVHDFRRYLQQLGVTPFFFGASIADPTCFSKPSFKDVQPVPDVAPLLKFEATFLDEATLKSNTMFADMLAGKLRETPGGGSKKRSKSLDASRPEPQKPPEYARRREEILSRHFPVTLERIRTGRYSEMLTAVSSNGIALWQFEQAICNLLLSHQILNGKSFYLGISYENLVSEIARAANAREENSEALPPNTFSPEAVLEQVRLDGIALLKSLQRSGWPSTLAEVQRELRDLALLEL